MRILKLPAGEESHAGFESRARLHISHPHTACAATGGSSDKWHWPVLKKKKVHTLEQKRIHGTQFKLESNSAPKVFISTVVFTLEFLGTAYNRSGLRKIHLLVASD